MMRKLIVAIAALLTFSAGAAAQQVAALEQARPTLKAEVVVTGDLVRIGDLVDNAGIVAFDQGHDLAIKVETHNHPSAIDPYGGAGTGIGGVIRDLLGAGLGARPIAQFDDERIAPLDRALREDIRVCGHGVEHDPAPQRE